MILILDNLKKLSAAGATINLRLPLIVPVNTDDQDIQDIISFLKENNIRILKTNLLPYHNTGNHKYEKLGEEYKRRYLRKTFSGTLGRDHAAIY